MAQETLKLVITADTKEALNNLQNFIKTSQGLKTEMQNFGKVGNQATQALSNLSRVAQDAPYGFMGIANNLNPLLESFQRLQKESGSSGAALKSLGQGLIGPAGIGLALGVASSLIVKFGDDIQKFITEKAVGLGKAFTKETEIVSAGVNAFVKARLEIVELNNEFNNYTNGVSTKESFLKKFNDTLGDTIKETKDLATAEKFLTDYADDYVQMTFKKAIATEAATQAAKKQVEAEIARAKPAAAFKGVGDFTTLFFGGNVASIDKVAKNRQNTIATNAENEVTLLESIRKKYQTQADGIQAEISKIFGPPQVKGPKSTFARDVAEQRKILDKEFNRIKGTFGTKKDEQYSDTFISPKAKTPERLQEGMSTFYKDAQQDNAIRTESILLTKQQTEANYQLAESLSTYVSDSFMNLWASMEQGVGIGQALGNMFMDLAKQIAAAALKALIFQTLINAFSGGAAAGTAVTGGFSKVFKGLLGLAEGGVVTRPTLAMVGEGNESEAVMPLSKLSGMLQTTFNAGTMSSRGGGGTGEFILRGSDLVLATQRANNNLKYRRG